MELFFFSLEKRKRDRMGHVPMVGRSGVYAVCVTVTRTYAYFNMWCEMALKCKCTKRILPHYHAEAVWGTIWLNRSREGETIQWVKRDHCKSTLHATNERKKRGKITRICVHVWRRMLLQNQNSHILCGARFNAIVFIAFSIFFPRCDFARPQKKVQNALGLSFRHHFQFYSSRIQVKRFVRCCRSLLEHWHLHLSCSAQPSTDCWTLCIAPSTRQSLYEFHLHCLYVTFY